MSDKKKTKNAPSDNVCYLPKPQPAKEDLPLWEADEAAYDKLMDDYFASIIDLSDNVGYETYVEFFNNSDHYIEIFGRDDYDAMMADFRKTFGPL